MVLRGILFSQMEPPAGAVEQFHDWYDQEHIPQRLAVPGFSAASRYEALEGEPRYLAVYELCCLSALDSPEYQALKQSPSERTKAMLAGVSGFTRYVCREVSDTGESPGGEYLYVVAFEVPAEAHAAFNDWYEDEHIPLLMRARDWLRVRRYEPVDRVGGSWTHLALHELASRDVLSSPERELARRGPKRAALARQPWFGERTQRWLYRLRSRVVAGAA